MTAYPLRIAASAAFALLVAAPVTAPAQSLADVARASNAKKKEQPKPGKVYTNDNLRQDITPSTPSVVTPATSDGTATATPAEAAPAAAAPAVSTDAGASPDGGSRDEKYWRGRMTAARDALERANSFAAALQSQINGLTTEFVNRDDPAQRAGIEQRRTKAVAELERVQREVEAAKKAIATVEDDARKAGVPAGWLR